MDLIPIIFSTLALILSCFAYKHTQDRFRLDLFEKRWQIYINILEFCSTVIKHGEIPKYDATKEDRNETVISALTAANESFRGAGFHKSKMLFGDDINDELDKLNEAYAFFTTDTGQISDADEWLKHATTINRMQKDLPSFFKPYLYFGKYTSNHWYTLP